LWSPWLDLTGPALRGSPPPVPPPVPALAGAPLSPLARVNEPRSSPPPADYRIDVILVIMWNGKQISPRLLYPITRQLIDFSTIETAIRSCVDEHHPDVDIDSLAPGAVAIHCFIQDSSTNPRKATQLIRDFPRIFEDQVLDCCDEMHEKISSRATVELDIVYRVVYEKPIAPASVARPTESPRQSRPRSSARSGTTPISEANFRERGSFPMTTGRRARTTELHDNAEIRTEAIRQGAASELDLKNRWLCRDAACTNQGRWCWTPSPAYHYPMDEVEIGQWSSQIRAGTASISHIPPSLAVHLAEKGPAAAHLLELLTATTATTLAERASHSLPQYFSPLRDANDCDVIIRFFAWMIAQQSGPVRVALWENTRDIVLRTGWTLRDLKDMNPSEAIRAEAIAEGIKAPVARQFQDRLREFRRASRCLRQ
jgi:hypothetical protein